MIRNRITSLHKKPFNFRQKPLLNTSQFTANTLQSQNITCPTFNIYNNNLNEGSDHLNEEDDYLNNNNDHLNNDDNSNLNEEDYSNDDNDDHLNGNDDSNLNEENDDDHLDDDNNSNLDEENDDNNSNLDEENDDHHLDDDDSNFNDDDLEDFEGKYNINETIVDEALKSDKLPQNICEFGPYFESITAALFFCWIQKHSISTRAYDELVDILKHPQFRVGDIISNIRRFRKWRQRLPLIPIRSHPIKISTKKTPSTASNSKPAYYLSISDIIWYVLNNESLFNKMYFGPAVETQERSEFWH
ncbi:hypothetical protein RhiirA4_478591, partial [Rhizophagus irregularis]